MPTDDRIADGVATPLEEEQEEFVLDADEQVLSRKEIAEFVRTVNAIAEMLLQDCGDFRLDSGKGKGGSTMTNEQLAALLIQYHARLKSALEQIDADLPEGVERFTYWEYVGAETMLMGLARCLSTPLKNPEDWEERPGDVVLLEPLWDIVNDIERAILGLSGGGETCCT